MCWGKDRENIQLSIETKNTTTTTTTTNTNDVYLIKRPY